MADINEKLMNGAGLTELWKLIGNKYDGLYDHWWKMRTITEGYVAVPKTSGAVRLGSGYAADSYTISEDGLFVLVDPVKLGAALSPRLGKYWIGNSEATGTTMYYTPANATLTTVTGPAIPGPGVTTWDAASHTTTYAVEMGTFGGEWQYVFSDDRNAFPDTGVENGMEYVYLGVPFENAKEPKGVAKIQTGSYVGTGTSGESNPNTLTFDFVPKYWGVMFAKGTASGYTKNFACGDLTPWMDGVTNWEMLLVGDADSGSRMYVTYSGQTVSWYSKAATGASGAQWNSADQTYYWIAIG